MYKMSDCKVAWKRSVLLCPKCYRRYLIKKKIFKIYPEIGRVFACMYACAMITDVIKNVRCSMLFTKRYFSRK